MYVYNYVMYVCMYVRTYVMYALCIYLCNVCMYVRTYVCNVGTYIMYLRIYLLRM